MIIWTLTSYLCFYFLYVIELAEIGLRFSKLLSYQPHIANICSFQ